MTKSEIININEAAQKSAIQQWKMTTDIDKSMQVLQARIFHEIGFRTGAEWMFNKMKEEQI